ncbi:hypothetical protein HanXRQr2_Chr00c019g0832921 [Helianthus annuus]|uniref:Uncharacterized protein n=1 Tax=Helianthus annuus TaxID=4232 RepID=A0A9K3JYV6_HELAN|nr:hypothetical protein HanXRQr2_Chr00c019g0832921 [Helianthus annuus]KAJ0941911.1 hypothetical protein HanPSC8_Chr03g0085671 [Helianthus annuus]
MCYKMQTIGTIHVLLAKVEGQNALPSANHRDHPCTFGNLGTKSKILETHRDYPCTLLKLKCLPKYTFHTKCLIIIKVIQFV